MIESWRITSINNSAVARRAARDHRAQAHLAGQNHRPARRGRVVEVARSRAHLPAEQGADDFTRLDESEGHGGRRLHFPHLLH